jgi:predicted aspartyl protease
LWAALIATPAVAQIPDRAVCGAPPASSAAQPTRFRSRSLRQSRLRQGMRGRPSLDFILDTGASMNFFDLHTAERLGLKLGDV